MSKLRRDLRLALAGACSGLFSVSMFLLLARVVAYYEYLRVSVVNDTRYDGLEDLLLALIERDLLHFRPEGTGALSTRQG